jgi:hypothetical protein
MVITEVEHMPEDINLRLLMRNRMQELRTEYPFPYVVMLFESHDISCPIYALVTPGANFNQATVHAHKLDLYQRSSYMNNTKVKVPKTGLCYQTNHNCNKHHTELIRFDKVCCVCVATTPAGNLVSVMKTIPELSTNEFWVYDFKDVYSNFLLEYHQTRIKVFGNYVIK